MSCLTAGLRPSFRVVRGIDTLDDSLELLGCGGGCRIVGGRRQVFAGDRRLAFEVLDECERFGFTPERTPCANLVLRIAGELVEAILDHRDLCWFGPQETISGDLGTQRGCRRCRSPCLRTTPNQPKSRRRNTPPQRSRRARANRAEHEGRAASSAQLIGTSEVSIPDWSPSSSRRTRGCLSSSSS